MHLRRIEVKDFRKIAHRVVEGLDDGLNVVVGDNEAGKSTLLAALRTVFFERHTLGGQTADLMLPYGAKVRPEISVDFELNGQTWHLRKAFCQRPEAELTGPGERTVGGAVEDRLAGLLGFTPPGRGPAQAEHHHGTHGLLWVQQGTRDKLGVGAARETLASALEHEVGQVTGGERGRALLAAAAQRREQFWTKADKPRGPFKDAFEDVERLEGEQAALVLRRQEHDAKVARLDDISTILARHGRDDRLGKAIAATASARRALGVAQQLDGVLSEATARRATAHRALDTAEERRARRANLLARAEAARLAAAAVEAEAAESSALARLQNAQATARDAATDGARRAHVAAQTQLRALGEAWDRRQAKTALARQGEQLALAETHDKGRRDAAARAGARGIDRDTVARLTKLETAAQTARAELNAASVQIAFEPAGAQSITLDGVAQSAAAPLSLSKDAVLVLEGFGRVVVRPGGGTAALLGKAQAAERALAEALAAVQLSSAAEAAVALDARHVAEAEAKALTATLTTLAPKGIEALRQAFETERARLSVPLSAEADALGDTADPDGLARARDDEAATRAAVLAADTEAKALADRRQSALEGAARLTERSAGAQRQALATAEELARARIECDDATLERQRDSAEAALAEAIAAEQRAKAALDAADPEAAQLMLQRADTAERVIRADIDALDREKRDIQAELRGSGHDGLGERLGEVEGQLDVARRQLAARQAEAAASRLLHDTLRAAQSEAKDRWLGPVRDKISPYLRLMHPDSEIVMDEHTLEIQGFSRNGVIESFEALSMGAREQVAVITRLALADVLRAAGHPATVILDDALVNTDEGRLDRMHNVLTRAAKGLQVLILTCRERDFVGLGKLHRM